MNDRRSGTGAHSAALDGTAGSPASSNAATPPLVVRTVHDWESVAALAAEMETLAADALEPSPSCEGWMLVPALRYLSPGASVSVITMHGFETSAAGQPKLCAVFVVEERKRFGRLPVRTLRLWDHMYSLSPAPLVHRDHARDCLRALFRWVAEKWPARTLIEFPNLRTDTAFFATLLDFMRGDHVEHTIGDLYSRAFFRPRSDLEEFMDSIGTKHTRREWRRMQRRLAEMGNLQYDMLDPTGDTAAWVDEFITLEMSGWKGRDGTAFGCNPDHRAYLSEVVAAAQSRGQLMMLASRLDGKPIAMKLNFVCPPGGYTFKIAFDETFGKYTPGTLLELENLRRLHERRDITWMDSLATPNHSLMDRVWRDRATLATVLAAPRRLSAEVIVAAVPLLRLARNRWRRGG